MSARTALKLALFVLLLPMLAARAAEVPSPAMALVVDADAGRQALALINATRSEQDLPPLAWDDRLSEAAQQHAELLRRNRQLSHQFPDEAPLQQRITKVDVRFATSGENVAVNYDVSGAHRAFMHSPGHRANILNPEFNSVAIAVVRDGDLLYFVEDFARKRPVLSNSDAARFLATRFAELRKKSGTQPLQQVSDSRVEEWACEDAQADKIATAQGSRLGASQAIAFSTAEIDTLPSDLPRFIETQAAGKYAIGVCYAQTARYPTGRYFVAVALFSTGTLSSASIAENHLPPVDAIHPPSLARK